MLIIFFILSQIFLPLQAKNTLSEAMELKDAKQSVTAEKTKNIPSEATDFANQDTAKTTSVKKKKSYNAKRKNFDFSFSNTPLVDVINQVAALKGINVRLPQGALAITSNLTYHLPSKISIENAWQEVLKVISIAGYTVKPENNWYAIIKTDQNTKSEDLAIYINEPYQKIKEDQEFIKALFYLTNLNVRSSEADLTSILKDMLSTNAFVKIDPKTNSLLLVDRAINIKSVMKIISKLDEGGIPDTIEVIPLYYTSAQLVDELFNKQLLGARQQPGTNGSTAASELAPYFPKNTKVFSLERSNALVVMGTPHGIDAVKDFIIKYIDHPLESGESILHIYDLQYLTAKDFAPILQQILTPAQTTDQATGKLVSGPQQYFKDVIVQAEIPKKTEQLTPATVAGAVTAGAAQATTTEGAQLGGNRLIIAARKKDWIRIKQLIEGLDKPQPQVALEVLVVDLSWSAEKIFGTQMRNKQGLKDSISPNVNFQSAELSEPVLQPAAITTPSEANNSVAVLGPNALMANLLQLNEEGGNIANESTAGSLIIALKDPQANGVWALLQILNNFTATTILAQPFLTTKNHQSARVTIAEDRLLQGGADNRNTSVTVNFEHVVAALTVDIMPHISANNNINLQIIVQINEFLDLSSNNRTTRIVQTNANVGNGEILAIGGLIRERKNIDINQVPLLGKIPILGWFFKRELSFTEKNNLMIFICPTIIRPRIGGGVDKFTSRKLCIAQQNLDESVNFENLRDPITRWFFKPNIYYGQQVIDSYVNGTFAEHALLYEGRNFVRSRTHEVKECPQEENVFCQDANALKCLLNNEENPLAKTQEVMT